MEVVMNSNVTSYECVCKTIMALKPNRLQVTTYHPQANAIIERVHKVINKMIRSFDLENESNRENLENYEDNPFDYILQSTAWLPCYYKHLSQNTAGNTRGTYQLVFSRDMIHNIFLQRKLGSNTNIKETKTSSVIPIKSKQEQ
jgi:hypothetical protein